MASATVVECAACRGCAIKCWRCTPSTPRATLSGSDSSGGGRDPIPAARARSRRTPRPAVSSDGSSDPMLNHIKALHQQAPRAQRSNDDNGPIAGTSDGSPKRGGGGRRRCTDKGRSGNSSDTRSDPSFNRREAERTLARYVPDDEARARALAAATASARSARDWYNARASEARASSFSSSTLSFNDSLSSSSSSSPPSPTSSSSSSSSSLSLWTKEDVLSDARGAINFCKSVLIGRYVQPRCVVMDLGCGRGQDVAKLAYARPRYVLFVDASELALVEAERRWRRTRFAFPAAFVQDDFCSPDGLLARRRIVIYRDDPQRAHGQRHRAITDLECTVKDGSELADAVSCQFALQHAFATRDTARAFVANVVRALKPGGVFVGIVADGASLWRHAQSQEATDRLEAASVLASVASCTPCLGIGGSGVEVRAVQPGRNSSKTTTIGSAHHDRLRSVIVDLPQLPNTTGESGSDRSHVPCALGIRAQGQPCPQYTVMFDDLCDMCTDAGLVLIATSNLTTFFDVESINPRNASMLDRMGAPWRLSNAQDRQHLGLYRTFVFVRQSSTDDAPISSAATPAGAIAPDQDTTTHRTLARAAGRALSYVWSSDVAS